MNPAMNRHLNSDIYDISTPEEVGSVVRSRGCSACCARRVYWNVNYFGVIRAIAMARAVVGHRERAVPVACWPSTIYGCSYELSIGLTTSLKTIDGNCWWGENAGASIRAWNKTCNTHLTGGVRWGTPLKSSFFIATLANPAARNSAILPVFTMCSWWKCTVFTMGDTPPFDGHMTLLTTLPTSSVSTLWTLSPAFT